MTKILYFQHDVDTQSDPMVVAMEAKHGNTGYGLLWKLYEMLARESSHRLKRDYSSLGFACRCEIETIKSIVEDFELFTQDNEYFYSESMNKRMEFIESKSQKARDSANRRWHKKGDNTVNKAIAIEEILKLYPKVILHNKALISIGSAINREIDKGKTEQNAIDFIKQGIKLYKKQLEDVKFATKACSWFDGGGYIINKENTNEKNEQKLSGEEQWKKEQRENIYKKPQVLKSGDSNESNCTSK